MRIPLCFALIFCLACDPGVEIEDIAPGKLLAVSSFISPQDTVFKVFVFRGSPLGSTVNIDSAAVKNALVTISDGFNYDTLKLTYETHPVTGRKSYRYIGRRKTVNVVANSRCYLQVKAESGENVSATCTIPPEPGMPGISGTQHGNDYNFSINWQNAAHHKYFMLSLDADGRYESTNQNGTVKVDLHPFFADDPKFPSDTQVAENTYEGVLPNAFIAENASLTVTVLNVDEQLYKYFKSFEDYEAWDANNSGTVLPNFKAMPVIYSNIKGGVGIFGGLNGKSTKIEF